MSPIACHNYVSVPRIRSVLLRVFPPAQLIGRESDGLTAEKQKNPAPSPRIFALRNRRA